MSDKKAYKCIKRVVPLFHAVAKFCSTNRLFKSGVVPVNQVTGLKLEILVEHALFQLRTHPFQKRVYVMLSEEKPLEKAM